MTRIDQYAISLRIDERPWGIFDTMSGGDSMAEEVKYSPGNMAPEVSLGGVKKTGNITLTKLYRLKAAGPEFPADHPRITALMNKVGRAKAEITKQPLDIDKMTFGKAIVYSGIVVRVMPPETDSNSSGPAMLEIEVSVSGDV